MIKLDFLVQTRDGATVTVARSVTVPDLIAIWSIIIKLARKIDEPGSSDPCGEPRRRSCHPHRRRLRPQSCVSTNRSHR